MSGDTRSPIDRAWNWFWTKFRAFTDTYARLRFEGNTRWQALCAAWRAMWRAGG